MSAKRPKKDPKKDAEDGSPKKIKPMKKAKGSSKKGVWIVVVF